MKKTISVLLAIIISVSSLYVCAYSEGSTDNSAVVEKDSGTVVFDSAFPEAGKAINAVVSGRENEIFLYKWYLDNEQVNEFSSSYTPSKGDFEKMLTVKVYDLNCEPVGTKSILLSEIPVVYIEVDNRQPVVSKDVALNAQMNIQGSKEYNDASVLYEGKTEIKGRGNSTWNASKKPYKLKLDSKADLFGMGKSKHWVLLSNPYDTSNMRNDIAFGLSADMGLDAQKSVWVDLVLNGKHVGIYQLCEHIRIEENRVNITNWDDIAEDAAKAIYKKNQDTMTKAERDELIDLMKNNMSWTTSDYVAYKGVNYKVSDYCEIPSINGGYLLEMNVKTGQKGFKSPSGLNIAVDKPEGAGTDMVNGIKDYYSAFENALMANDYCTVYQGQTMRYTDFIDVDSFVKGILINEIFENSDFGLKSTWMSKDVDGKLVYGPIWDMDYSIISAFNVWTTAKKAWIKRMLSDPVFMEKFRSCYFEYRATAINDMIVQGGDIDKAFEKIYGASVRNDEIWNNTIKYENNVDDFLLRLQTKINWMDKQLETLSSALSSVAASSAYMNSSDISLKLDGKSLTVGFSTVPASAKVFADGVLVEEIASPLDSQNVALADSDCVITVIAYDANGKPIKGNYINGKSYITNLSITHAPDVTTYSAGEELNLSGLEITATMNNGETKTVSPDIVYTYVSDTIGIKRFSYNRVSENIGNTYAVFMCGNLKVEQPLTILPRENSDEVEKKISEIPEDNTSSEYYLSLFNAQIMYDALSTEAKAKVKNASVLTGKMDDFKNDTSAADVSVVYCVGDGVMRNDAKNNIIVLVKGTARNVIFNYPHGGTSTYAKDNKNVLTIKDVGRYHFWTINHSFTSTRDYYDLHGSYSGSPQKTDYHMVVDDVLYPKGDITSITCKNYAVANKEFAFDVVKSDNVSALEFSDNGTVLDTEIASTQNGQRYTVKFDSTGKHTITVKYQITDTWIEYKSFDIFVRDDVETGKVFYADYSYQSDSFEMAAKVITDSAVNDVSLKTETDTVSFTSQSKNGYKIWNGKLSSDSEYAVFADGIKISEMTVLTDLGDVNLDGQINSADALLTLRFATEELQPSDDEKRRADINTDGVINSQDALIMLRIATGMINV